MNIGDLVRDIDADQIVIIVGKNPEWIDTDDQKHIWDFEVMSRDEGLYFVDIREIEVVND
jgi:hypothetical protein